MDIWLVVLLQAILQFPLVFPLNESDQGQSCKNVSNDIQWLEKEKTYTRYQRYLGEWWTANCQVKNLNVEATLWQELASEEEDVSRRKRIVDKIKLRRENNLFNLTNISFSDAGAYYCEVCGTKKRVGGFRVITDGKAFQYPQITNKPNHSLEFGADVKLICKVSGKYDFFWRKDGARWSHSIRRTIVGKGTEYYKKSELTIRNFSKQNEGMYSCHARRMAVKWHVQDKVRLKLKAFAKPAFITIPNNVVSLEEGKALHLSVLAAGYPQPKVKCWQENKRKIKIIENGTSNFLYISEVMYSLHNGTRFQCRATNLIGSSTRKFSLNIWVKPKINMHEHGQTKTVSMDSTTLSLECNVSEANPLATVQWRYSNDEQAWSPITPSLKFADIDGSTLQLKEQKFYKMFYKCVAKNNQGKDVFTWEVLKEATAAIASSSQRSSPSKSSYFIVIIVISCIVAVLILCFVIVLYRRKKVLGGFYICTLPPDRCDYIEILDQTKFIHEQTHKLPYLSEWEFPRESILLQEELGSGAFGRVYLADAVGMERFLIRRNTLKKKSPQRRFSFVRYKKQNVLLTINDYDVVKTAVKTLKDNYSQNDLADIISELKVLIHVGEHENVLRILGACTKVKNNEAPLIILEYCPHGNLREYLRARRDIYEPEWKEVDNVHLSVTDIATFSLHVAKGMEFLISRKCIHRDLAARNVLVSDGYVAKISDFGLARDVYDNLEYVKVTPGLLPVKWMAIEAIQDRIFNEKTDAWSYGIVLWEMFTLGGTPYPDLEPSLVLHTLMAGKRMRPPMYCPQEISDVMLSCWNKDPLQRPSFSDIVCQLQKLCEYPNTVDEDLHYQNVS